MGIFDIFKEERTTFGTLHGMDIREWNDGYKNNEKGMKTSLFLKLCQIGLN